MEISFVYSCELTIFNENVLFNGTPIQIQKLIYYVSQYIFDLGYSRKINLSKFELLLSDMVARFGA